MLGVLALFAAALWFVFLRGDDARRVVADFTHVEGIHPGSKVDVLGVPLGRVESVRPRGGAVRVTMTLREDVELPADVNAYVMNPSVISARFIELGPVYRGGARYSDGDVIPVARTHAPINWDELLGSFDTIADALGPDGGDVGSLIDQAAQVTDGLGASVHRAIEQVGSATSLIGARADQIGALVDDLDRIADALGARQGRIADTVRSLAALGDEMQRQDLDVGTPVTQLNSLFDRVGALLESRSDDVAGAIADARAVTGLLASKPANLAEFLDLTPLALQNIDRAIGPDERARLRLDVSSSGDQFAVTRRLCDEHPGPLCFAPGLTNPVPIPLSRSDPFGPLVERFGEEGR
ncbi:MCE family protein [Tomitella fengzijianii]|uniref:MCE family protein n=1 Tax=Tomitella fengzijianii TaxID=2597660 RepID=A0A516X7F8_9ACTN|nr:MCE family protein [Tomitella fengzijianii]